MNSDYVWGLLVGAGLLYEAHTIRTKAPGDTFSEKVRRLFYTHTKPGRAVFTATWAGFSVWFLLHILFENM